jgi:UDP:flavonoid glycosyltransferase YjiC (YdhE family)
VYIGFGSIVVDDPDGLTALIMAAIEKTGVRALVSQGWGGLGTKNGQLPANVFMLGNCPHDWLFPRVSCVVHHGGAGTMAAGIAAGKPTVIVPFFGDQPFWGDMIARAGAGPAPIPYKKLTVDGLAAAIQEALRPETTARAEDLAAKIKEENGVISGMESFSASLPADKMRCSVLEEQVAVWRYKKSDILLSAPAAAVLAEKKHLDYDDLKL